MEPNYVLSPWVVTALRLPESVWHEDHMSARRAYTTLLSTHKWPISHGLMTVSSPARSSNGFVVDAYLTEFYHRVKPYAERMIFWDRGRECPDIFYSFLNVEKMVKRNFTNAKLMEEAYMAVSAWNELLPDNEERIAELLGTITMARLSI